MKTNRIIALLLLCATLNTAYGQLPNGTMAPNIVGNDIFGNPHSLHDYLGQGYTVILHASATWCTPCLNYHNSNTLQDFYDQYGPDGTDEVMVLLIEGWEGTVLADFYGTGPTSVGDFATGTPYPILDYDPVLTDYALSYFPTIFKVCPSDSTVTEIGQITGTTLTNAVFSPDCGIPCSTDNPVSGLNSTIDAGDVTLSWDPVDGSIGCRVKLRKVGTTDLMSKTLFGSEVSSIVFPTNVLEPGTHKWRVKCACSVSSTDVTPNTAYEFFDITTAREGLSTASIWPNPATDFIQIKVGNEGYNIFRLINAHGKIVLENFITESQQQVDISDLAEGVYYMELVSTEETKVETIIISRN